jgi:hypothetical protein
MAARDTRAGRKPRATGTRYQGRSYATTAAPKRERDEGPSKREQAASDALAAVLDLFASDELPARIADTVIARQAGTSPMVNWSLGNQLVAIVNGTTDARGFRQWHEVGRHVSKGSKAFYILGPKKRTITDRDESTGDEAKRTIITGFVGIPVFRYEDTDGDALEVASYEPAAFPPLFDVAERFGVSVSYAPFVRDFRGYYAPGTDRIVLCTHDVSTFFHELAHAAHARVLADRGDSIQGGQHSGQEIVAELSAAVLCKLYDYDGHLAKCREYVNAYAGENPGRAVMRVLSDVQVVLFRILETAGDELPAAARELELAA